MAIARALSTTWLSASLQPSLSEQVARMSTEVGTHPANAIPPLYESLTIRPLVPVNTTPSGETYPHSNGIGSTPFGYTRHVTTIRSATPDDASMIAAIHVEAWRVAYRGIVPDEFLDSPSIDGRESTWRQILSSSHERVWVAQESETIVGWISAAASRDADAGASTGEIWAVYVAPGRWRKGVGRALCETAERHLRLAGFIEVTLWVLKDNEQAVKFYQSNGFVLDVGHEKSLERGGKTLTEVRFRKWLIARSSSPS